VIENLYGPTELTVGCTHYRLAGDPGDWPNTSNNTLPIGQVYDFLDHLVLDESGQVADEGELCVRGVQRFDGYLDPKDDDNRFTSEGYYRTGDRVRMETGELVHLGRLDSQLKVHGYRVEAGEIESAMRTMSGVTQAIVVVTAGRDANLVGYYCGDPVPEHELRNRLRGLLPIYMVPRRFQHMEALPVNGNGKIDRAELATIAGR
jgi:acyl-coenzyme A synthetase/AMP-(fatty) acid ligase